MSKFIHSGNNRREVERVQYVTDTTTMKHMAADAKKKVGNMTAKAEEKMEKAKASATEKVS